MQGGFLTLIMIAFLFGVQPTTLRSAISRTEREIERAPDRRGRPKALTDLQVLD